MSRGCEYRVIFIPLSHPSYLIPHPCGETAKNRARGKNEAVAMGRGAKIKEIKKYFQGGEKWVSSLFFRGEMEFGV